MTERAFSIVVPTRNRARQLRDAIASILDVDYPRDAVELVVVDNASSDDTRGVVEEAAARAPFDVRYVREEKLGSSSARNAGLRVARGRHVFFTDDDQVVAREVLLEHERVLRATGAPVVQGGIALRFPDGRPAWIHGMLAGYLGETATKPEGLSDIHVFSGNLVVARDVAEALGGFDEGLGKGRSGYAEDIDFGLRARAAGHPIAYAPSALIYHVIPASRASAASFRRVCVEKGYSEVLSTREPSSLPRVAIAGAQALAASVRAAVVTALGDEHRGVCDQVDAATKVGRFVGHVGRCFPAAAPLAARFAKNPSA